MNGVIRKIIIGRDPKDAMAYYVGMRAGSGEVSAIVLDDEHLHRYDKKRYLVYIQIERARCFGSLSTTCHAFWSLT